MFHSIFIAILKILLLLQITLAETILNLQKNSRLLCCLMKDVKIYCLFYFNTIMLNE